MPLVKSRGRFKYGTVFSDCQVACVQYTGGNENVRGMGSKTVTFR